MVALDVDGGAENEDGGVGTGVAEDCARGCGVTDALVCTGMALDVWVGTTAVGGEAAGARVCATGGVSRTDFVRASFGFRCNQAFNETATIPAKQASRTEANRAGTL